MSDNVFARDRVHSTLLDRTSLPNSPRSSASFEFSDRVETASRINAADLQETIRRTQSWLLRQQKSDGHWCAPLEGDTILESETILLFAFLNRGDDQLCKKLAQRILDQQLPTGGWAIYPGGDLEISASVKAYFALKLTGHDPASEPLQRARAAIVKNGGADRVNSFTRFYLALLGQISYDCCPEVPPEVVLLPKQSPINIWRMSAWSRPMIITLSIMSALRPLTNIAPECSIQELFIQAPEKWKYNKCPGLKSSLSGWMWEKFFHGVDRTLKLCRRIRFMPLRKRSLNIARDWMIERFAGSDGLAAIFPPMVWSLIAMRALGIGESSREWRYAMERLMGLVREKETTAQIQPCKSPVWDTAIAIRALCESGISPRSKEIQSATEWLVDREIQFAGDWTQNEKMTAPPSGWAFEYENQFYPDADDTAMVLMALAHQYDAPKSSTHSQPNLETESHDQTSLVDDVLAATHRGSEWMQAMQNSDGGWGAFDRDNDCEFLCRVPFADHNAMIDPSTPDLAARALEALGRIGRRVGDATVDRTIEYLRKTQQADGSWFGRWGVNYIYGTWQVLQGLAAVGFSKSDPLMTSGANWLIAHQQPSGGWGESPRTYEQPELRGQGNTTASQTAWALMGLISAGLADHAAVERGVEYLLVRQKTDGTWDEPEWTGTGFPQVFYLKYHYYPIYFPLMALGLYSQQSCAKRLTGNC